MEVWITIIVIAILIVVAGCTPTITDTLKHTAEYGKKVEECRKKENETRWQAFQEEYDKYVELCKKYKQKPIPVFKYLESWNEKNPQQRIEPSWSSSDDEEEKKPKLKTSRGGFNRDGKGWTYNVTKDQDGNTVYYEEHPDDHVVW